MRRTVLIYTIAEFTASEPDYFYHAKLFAGTHHEKRNGSGYPNGLSGKEILLQGRLVARVNGNNHHRKRNGGNPK